MCLIIDACCISRVFNEKNQEHCDFLPVLEWVTTTGYIILGGTKYFEEVETTMLNYVRILAELRRRGRVIRIPDDEVDSIAKKLKEEIPEKKFNDEHILALVIASRCAVVCTVDDVAKPYLLNNAIFRSRKIRRPRIYQGGAKQASLCCERNIAGVCKKAKSAQDGKIQTKSRK